MTVLAIDVVRRMRGGSQSQLLLGADGQLWVVKFQNNPQHLRVLANELIATRLAEAIGFTVPTTDIVYVSELLTKEHPNMEMELPGGRRERYLPGQHFGCVLAGSEMPGMVVDLLPEEDLKEVLNLEEFVGMLAFDKWTGNCDSRQAVFHRPFHEKKYSATFIDQGYCFNAAEWNFPDNPRRGVYLRNVVYARVTGWASFEPWLSRIEAIDLMTITRIAEGVPPLWYDCDAALIQGLVRELLVRTSRVRELIMAFRDLEFDPFPSWTMRTVPSPVTAPSSAVCQEPRSIGVNGNARSISPDYL